MSGCICDPEACDLGPEGQKRHFPYRTCPIHGDREWIAEQDDSPFRTDVVDELAVRRSAKP